MGAVGSKEKPPPAFCPGNFPGPPPPWFLPDKFSHYTKTECCVVVSVQHFNHICVTSSPSCYYRIFEFCYRCLLIVVLG